MKVLGRTNNNKSVLPKDEITELLPKDYDDLLNKPIENLGTFNDETELITHAVTNQLPTGHYTFIMDGFAYFMLLRLDSGWYFGTFFSDTAEVFYFVVTIHGEILALKTIDLRDLEDIRTDIDGLTKSDVGLGNVDNVKQMPISGGVLENYTEKLTTVSASSGSINLSLGNVFVHTPSGNRTYTISNAVNGQAHSFTLIINMGSTVRTLTFPASVKWQGGEIPDMSTADKTYVLTFVSVDGGTTWLGMFGGEF